MLSFRPMLLLWAGLALPIGGLVLRNSTIAEVKHQQHKQQDKDNVKAQDKTVRTDDQLHQCLSGKRIVFIGPSTAKADYMALAYFAEYGRWPTEDIVFYGMSGAWGPNPLDEAGIGQSQMPPGVAAPIHRPGCVPGGNWESSFRYTNSMFNGHEACDCHEIGNWKGAYDMYNSTENRVYIKGDTMISYFQWFGDIVAPRGAFDISPLLKQPAEQPWQQCPVGQFPGKWAWSMSLPQLLKTVIRAAKPTHVVLSSSFWPVNPLMTQFWNEVADAGVQAVMDTGGQVIWRTTPQRTDHAFSYVSPRVDMAPFIQKGWNVFPAQQLVKSYQGYQPNDAVFYDFAHIRPKTQCVVSQNFLQTHVCPGMV